MARTLTQTGMYSVTVQDGTTLSLPEHFGRVTAEEINHDGTIQVAIDGVQSEAIEQYLDQHDDILEYYQVAPVLWEDDEESDGAE